MSIKYSAFNNSGSSILLANQAMTAGQYLSSQNQVFALHLKPSGDLVLEKNGAAVWYADSSQAYSITLSKKRMREPLQFVISNSGFLFDPGRRRAWIAEPTQTLDKSYWYNNCLRVTDEGNLVIYDQRNGEVRWARYGFVPGRLPPPKLVGHIYYDASIPVWDWKFG